MKATLSLQIAKVVGTPNDGFWSQVHTFFPEEPERKEKRGDLLAVLVIAGVSQGIEAVSAGREVLSRLHEEYYGNLAGTAFERLKLAVKKVSQENEDLEIVAAVLVGEALYLAIYGEGQVLLKRGEEMGVVLKGNGELQTASGFLKADDFLVIGSYHFFKVVEGKVLKASLESGSTEEAVEQLAPLVLGRQDVAAAAAILALAKKEEELTIQPVSAEAEVLPPVTEGPGLSLPKSAVKFKLPALPKIRIALPFFHRTGGTLEEGLTQRPFFVRREGAEKKKRLYFLLSILLLALLGVSLVFGAKRKMAERRQSQVRALVKQAEEKLREGKLLADSQPSQGKVLGEEAVKLTDEALVLDKKGNEEVTFLKGEAEKFLSSLGQEVSLSEPPVLMDLNIIADGAKGVSLALMDKNLAILDSEKKKVYLFSIEKKSSTVVDYPGEGGSLIAASPGKAFVFDPKGIFEISNSSAKASLVIAKDSDWKEIIGLSSYLGHLYLLDRGGSNVWRYLYGEGQFGAKKSWFLGTPPDLSASTSLSIDGSVWILDKDKIRKYTLGKEENFALNKMPAGLIEAAKIYTTADLQNLYVLDKGSGKIYVIAKTGDFQAVYSWEGFKSAQDLVAVELMKKLFVLSETKIYSVELK